MTAGLALAAVAAAADVRGELAAAAAEYGCRVDAPERDIKPLAAPHDGVWEVRCDDGRVVWFRATGDGWELKPLG